MPIFVVAALDGSGDMGHFFDIVLHYMDQQHQPDFKFFQDEPVILLVSAGGRLMPNFIKMMEDFKSTYPHIPLIYHELVTGQPNDATNMTALFEKAKGVKGLASCTTLFEVSTSSVSHLKLAERYFPRVKIITRMGEHGAPTYWNILRDDRYKEGLLFRHMGFEKHHFGVMVTEAKSKFPKQSEPETTDGKEKKPTASAIENPALRAALLAAGSDSEIFFIPAYIKNLNFLMHAIRGIMQSPLGKDYDEYVVLVNQPVSLESIHSELQANCNISLYQPDNFFPENQLKLTQSPQDDDKISLTIITTADNQFKISNSDYDKLFKMAKVAVCSGDKSLERCIRNGLLFFYETPITKRYFYEYFLELIAKYTTNRKLLNIFKACQHGYMEDLRTGLLGMFHPYDSAAFPGVANKFLFSTYGKLPEGGRLQGALKKYLSTNLLQEWADVCSKLKEFHNFSNRLGYVFFTSLTGAKILTDNRVDANMENYIKRFTPEDKKSLVRLAPFQLRQQINEPSNCLSNRGESLKEIGENVGDYIYHSDRASKSFLILVACVMLCKFAGSPAIGTMVAGYLLIMALSRFPQPSRGVEAHPAYGFPPESRPAGPL